MFAIIEGLSFHVKLRTPDVQVKYFVRNRIKYFFTLTGFWAVKIDQVIH